MFRIADTPAQLLQIERRPKAAVAPPSSSSTAAAPVR
jgi:hypothetical protein